MILNQISDELKEKLPPTDCRLRPDMRYWEHNDLENAEAEKHQGQVRLAQAGAQERRLDPVE